MVDNNPNQPLQSPVTAADNCWLRVIAKALLGIGIACFAIGAVLVAISVCMMNSAINLVTMSDTVLPAEAVAVRIANAAVPWRIGVPFAILGDVAVVLSGVIWFPVRKANRKTGKETQTP
jgi:hypothetical protein